MQLLKKAARTVLPASLWRRLTEIRRGKKFGAQDRYRDYRNMPVQQLFSEIYEQGLWGQSEDSSQPYFSGSGSHAGEVVTVYIQSVGQFLQSFPEKPDVVDLGCGDFFVGSRLRPLCNHYIACDVVPKLIEFNRGKYSGLDVDFRVIDITEDELPAGDVVFIRQVLQHLSNAHIARVLPKLAATYKYIVLTEHVYEDPAFIPNLNKPAGPDIRTSVGSGVVITSPPFNFKARSETVLCEADDNDAGGGKITTTLYRLA